MNKLDRCIYVREESKYEGEKYEKAIKYIEKSLVVGK